MIRRQLLLGLAMTCTQVMGAIDAEDRTGAVENSPGSFELEVLGNDPVAGTVVEPEIPLGPKGMGEPAFTVSQRFGVGMEHGAAPATAEEFLEHLGLPAIGQVHGDAAGRGDPCGCQFGGHASGSPAAAITGAILKAGQLGGMVHIRDRMGTGVNPRIG